MANLGTTFDASAVDPTSTYDVLPPGKYTVQIVNSEMRPTSNGLGQYLWLELDVLDGEHAGRKLFDRLNLVNANTQTVEIAQRTLSAICHATGKMQVTDSEELHLIPLQADVTVQPRRTATARATRSATGRSIRRLPPPRQRRPRARSSPRPQSLRSPAASPTRPGSARPDPSRWGPRALAPPQHL